MYLNSDIREFYFPRRPVSPEYDVVSKCLCVHMCARFCTQPDAKSITARGKICKSPSPGVVPNRPDGRMSGNALMARDLLMSIRHTGELLKPGKYYDVSMHKVPEDMGRRSA